MFGRNRQEKNPEIDRAHQIATEILTKYPSLECSAFIRKGRWSDGQLKVEYSDGIASEAFWRATGAVEHLFTERSERANKEEQSLRYGEGGARIAERYRREQAAAINEDRDRQALSFLTPVLVYLAQWYQCDLLVTPRYGENSLRIDVEDCCDRLGNNNRMDSSVYSWMKIALRPKTS